MKTDNMYVKFTGKDGDLHINGKKYAVHSAERKSSDFSRFPICVQAETEVSGQFKTVWMPESMKKGDISIAGTYEFGVTDPEGSDLHGMSFEIYIPEPAKPLSQVVEDLIDASLKPGGRAYEMLKVGAGDKFIKESLIGKGSFLHANGTFELMDGAGNARVRVVSLAEHNASILNEVRKALRCPEGADIVTWAEILAAGYFGEKHRKGGAIEDAIHYNKNGAYSDEALAKILAAIVNDGTIC